jgi:hypothetical protein
MWNIVVDRLADEPVGHPVHLVMHRYNGASWPLAIAAVTTSHPQENLVRQPGGS